MCPRPANVAAASPVAAVADDADAVRPLTPDSDAAGGPRAGSCSDGPGSAAEEGGHDSDGCDSDGSEVGSEGPALSWAGDRCRLPGSTGP